MFLPGLECRELMGRFSSLREWSGTSSLPEIEQSSTTGPEGPERGSEVSPEKKQDKLDVNKVKS